MTVIDRTLSATELSDAEVFLGEKYGVTVDTDTDPYQQARAQTDIQEAIRDLSDVIDTLQGELNLANELAKQTAQELEDIRNLLSRQSIIFGRRADLLPLMLQISNPQAFGAISGTSFLRDVIA